MRLRCYTHHGPPDYGDRRLMLKRWFKDSLHRLLTPFWRAQKAVQKKHKKELIVVPYKHLALSNRIRATQAQSTLLTLPTEIRWMIWEHVISTDPVALFRKNERITCGHLKGEEWRDIEYITPATIKEMAESEIAGKTQIYRNLGVVALLQTCQMM